MSRASCISYNFLTLWQFAQIMEFGCPKDNKYATTALHAYDQPLASRPQERRYIREIIFGKRCAVRYYQITKGSTDNPDKADSWFIMTNLPGDMILSVGSQYTLRTTD